MHRRIEGAVLASAIFVIAYQSDEALDPVRGQLELEAQSREAIVAYASTAIHAPLVPGKVEVRGGVLEATVAPKRSALPRRR